MHSLGVYSPRTAPWGSTLWVFTLGGLESRATGCGSGHALIGCLHSRGRHVGVYILGAYTLGCLPILDLVMYSLWGLHSEGLHFGVCTLGLHFRGLESQAASLGSDLPNTCA